MELLTFLKIFNEPPEDPNYREENQEVFRKVSELMQQPHSNNKYTADYTL